MRFAALAVAFAAFVYAGCSSSEEEDLFPVGAGIQQNLTLSSLTGAGWTVCYEDTYVAVDVPITDVLAACQGTYMMLACGQVGSGTLALAAADRRSTVVQQDAEGLGTHHVSGSVGWYYTPTQSWGFFPAGQSLERDSCDTLGQAMGDRRLCWHAFAGTLQNGYRCGEAELNFGDTWRRLVLVR